MVRTGKVWVLALAGVLLAGSGGVWAAELKIGYLDAKAALQNTKAYQQGIRKLEALQNQKKKELDAMRKKIEQAEKELQSQSMAMAPERLQEKQNQINKMRKEFSRALQDANDEIENEKNRLLVPVGSKLQRVVKEYGKSKHYDFIFGQPVLMYADPKHDITAEITKLLDKN
ncbi:MAG: OmpH family outer membrane protein [Zetaproteobacteria bacterium]|nr:MAG: OmpH family outer membrane protein [Zetaproteobacteria bacterium]